MLKKVLDSFIDIGGRAYFIQEECFLSLSLSLVLFALVLPISFFLCSFFSSVFNICLHSFSSVLLFSSVFSNSQFCHIIFLNYFLSFALLSRICTTVYMSILLSLYNSIDSHAFSLYLPFSLKNSLTLSH